MSDRRDDREVAESPKDQGDSEERAYSYDFAKAGVVSITGTPVMEVLDLTTGQDVTATVCPGTPTASGTVVTSPLVKSLTAGHEYRVLCRALHDGGQKTELFLRLFGRS